MAAWLPFFRRPWAHLDVLGKEARALLVLQSFVVHIHHVIGGAAPRSAGADDTREPQRPEVDPVTVVVVSAKALQVKLDEQEELQVSKNGVSL